MNRTELQALLEELAGRPLPSCTKEELYSALVKMTNKLALNKQNPGGKKKIYYISAEFLIGKLLSNNLIKE